MVVHRAMYIESYCFTVDRRYRFHRLKYAVRLFYIAPAGSDPVLVGRIGHLNIADIVQYVEFSEKEYGNLCLHSLKGPKIRVRITVSSIAI